MERMKEFDFPVMGLIVFCIKSMTQTQREILFDKIDDYFCLNCGEEQPCNCQRED